MSYVIVWLPLQVMPESFTIQSDLLERMWSVVREAIHTSRFLPIETAFDVEITVPLCNLPSIKRDVRFSRIHSGDQTVMCKPIRQLRR